ncbi:MAG TPA: hypothetical protein VMT09_16770 [Steroidobacteraceae bacterium]|nr:hypothetical protein [Steroidobacteraceae bacterium]
MVTDSRLRHTEELRLKPGVSLSQTRFALANFCLSHFGADGQYYADVIDLCVDASRLQEALNSIAAEVGKRCPDQMPALAACVREANDTDLESSASGLRAAPRAATQSEPASRTAAPASRPAAPAAARAAPARPAAAADPLRLAPAVSLAQGRFALSEFCLNQFGARSQQLVDAINAAADLAGLQAQLGRVVAEVKEHRREALAELLECVREINSTGE